MVLIECMTYNHANYIEDAMRGFVMQKTTFPYVAVVVDDASTDGEPEVIKRFLEKEFDMSSIAQDETEDYLRVVARHKTNENCTFVVVCLKYNHYSIRKQRLPYFKEWFESSKYIALCEGDDYWTDSMKLQKQVDFLEKHEDYSMCFHSAQVKLEGVDSSKIGARCENIESKEYSSTDVFAEWIVPTASVVYRREVVDEYPIKHADWLTRGDICLVLKCTHTGRVWGMSETMSVYRMQPNSVSHNPAIRDKEIYQLANHFKCLYYNFPNVEKESIVWCISHAYYGRMKAPNRNIWQRFVDLLMFIYWDPKYACEKLISIFKTMI